MSFFFLFPSQLRGIKISIKIFEGKKSVLGKLNAELLYSKIVKIKRNKDTADQLAWKSKSEMEVFMQENN